MTRRYKVELFCKIVAFRDLIVEAETPEQAREVALKDAWQLSAHDWDLDAVDEIDLNTLGLPAELVEEACDDGS